MRSGVVGAEAFMRARMPLGAGDATARSCCYEDRDTRAVTWRAAQFKRAANDGGAATHALEAGAGRGVGAVETGAVVLDAERDSGKRVAFELHRESARMRMARDVV